MTDEALYCDPQLAQFYDWTNPWPKDFDFFASLVTPRSRVLDLGCGAGIFSTALAASGHRVTGVDPAAAMLAIARNRDGGDGVRWIEADAREVDLNEQFDMVLMTGHAFQTMLTPADRAALIGTIARHLEPGARFFFDSRNPLFMAWERWTPGHTRQTQAHPKFGKVEHWTDATLDPASGIVTYETHYLLESGETFAATTQIDFPSQSEIATLIKDADLDVARWFGDYAGGSFTENSAEIIPLGFRPA